MCVNVSNAARRNSRPDRRPSIFPGIPRHCRPWIGRVLTVRDPFYASSKTCSECGYGMEVLPLSVREWTCPACQTTHDRDVNAAINRKQNTVGYTGINAWGQEGSGLAGTASETGLVEPGTLPWVNTHFHSQERRLWCVDRREARGQPAHGQRASEDPPRGRTAEGQAPQTMDIVQAATKPS